MLRVHLFLFASPITRILNKDRVCVFWDVNSNTTPDAMIATIIRGS